MESSTNLPTPSASPPSVIIFNVTPLNLKNIKVSNIDNGIAVKIIIVLLRFLKNTTITMTARTAPSAPSRSSPLIESLIYSL